MKEKNKKWKYERMLKLVAEYSAIKLNYRSD